MLFMFNEIMSTKTVDKNTWNILRAHIAYDIDKNHNFMVMECALLLDEL